MAERGTYLCATVGIIKAIIDEPTSPEFSRQACVKVQEIIHNMLSTAIQENVLIVVGTDGNHGKMAVELEALIKCGYTHAQALKALTSTAAKFLGLEAKVGSIKAGLKADLVAIQGNPLVDIYAISNIQSVYKDGKEIYWKTNHS
jgi:imidazolonepropionase-like amidohydrolase